MKWLGFLLGAAIVAGAWVITSFVTENGEEAGSTAAPGEPPAAAGRTRVPAAAAPAESSLRVAVTAEPASAGAPDKEPPPAEEPTGERDQKSLVDRISPGVRQQLEQAERSDVRISSISDFIELLGYVPEQEALDRIVLIMLETTQRHDARVRAFFEEKWTRGDPEELERRSLRMEQMDREYNTELRDRLRPYVRPEVFEEAYGRWSGQWYVDHPEERRERPKD